MDAQERFFSFLTNRLDKRVLLDDSMDTLHLRRAAVYKRISGDTALTLEEAATLARHFEISLDTAVGLPSVFAFRHPFMNIDGSEGFLRQFVEIMTPILHNEDTASELTYLAHELPVFYYFSYDYIFQFLVASWNHLHWSRRELVIHRDERIDQTLLELRGRIVDHYQSRPTVEIWNSAMLANLYQKILFAIDLRAFRDGAFIDRLIADLDRLIKDLKALTYGEGTGESTARNHVKVYVNEFGNYHNMVLFEAGALRATGIGYDMPQFMISHDRRLYDYSKAWVEKLKRRSINITDGGLRHRERFFERLDEDLARFKERARRAMQ